MKKRQKEKMAWDKARQIVRHNPCYLDAGNVLPIHIPGILTVNQATRRAKEILTVHVPDWAICKGHFDYSTGVPIFKEDEEHTVYIRI